MTKCLLIDARNLLYRALYAHIKKNHKNTNKNHPITLVLSFIKEYYNKFQPDQIHVFWDDINGDIWRKDIDSNYKSNRGNDKNISNQLKQLTTISISIFNNIGFRQYYKSRMEADDLIYAFCKIHRHYHNIIISNDSDLNQISYYFDNVKIHNHMSKSNDLTNECPTTNPIFVKCLSGDKADNIDGFNKIGNITAQSMASNIYAINEFINNDNDKVEKFKRNLLLIDLSLCPYLLDNMIFILSKQSNNLTFDIQSIYKLISKYKLGGLLQEMASNILPFKKLVEGE